jgi:preprotein translocase subunit Sss1
LKYLEEISLTKPDEYAGGSLLLALGLVLLGFLGRFLF